VVDRICAVDRSSCRACYGPLRTSSDPAHGLRRGHGVARSRVPDPRVDAHETDTVRVLRDRPSDLHILQRARELHVTRRRTSGRRRSSTRRRSTAKGSSQRRDLVKGRSSTFYAKRTSKGRFKEMDEPGRPLASDRRRKAKTKSKGDYADRAIAPRLDEQPEVRGPAMNATSQTTSRTVRTWMRRT